jgi:hypothetical protein
MICWTQELFRHGILSVVISALVFAPCAMANAGGDLANFAQREFASNETTAAGHSPWLESDTPEATWRPQSLGQPAAGPSLETDPAPRDEWRTEHAAPSPAGLWTWNENSGNLFDGLSLFGGLDGSKQPQDLGVNANMGGRVAFNWGIPIVKEWGLGVQVGAAYNFADNAVQVLLHDQYDGLASLVAGADEAAPKSARIAPRLATPMSIPGICLARRARLPGILAVNLS